MVDGENNKMNYSLKEILTIIYIIIIMIISVRIIAKFYYTTVIYFCHNFAVLP